MHWTLLLLSDPASVIYSLGICVGDRERSVPCPRGKAQVKFHLALGTVCCKRVVDGGRRLPKLPSEGGFTEKAKYGFKAFGAADLALVRQRDGRKIKVERQPRPKR